MNTFSWKIPQDSMVTAKSIDNLTDVVVTVKAFRQISNETTSIGLPVCVVLTSPTTEQFIPYADLTQEVVEGWLNAGTDMATLDAQLATQFDNMINPKTVVLPNPF
jgi:hypothetical protein